jgi:hypothetical protein
MAMAPSALSISILFSRNKMNLNAFKEPGHRLVHRMIKCHLLHKSEELLIECAGNALNTCSVFSVFAADNKYSPAAYKRFNILTWALHRS